MNLTMAAFIVSSLLLFMFCLQHHLAASSISRPFLFSDKTQYHHRNEPIEKPPNCEAVHISMVIRHGSRYPGSVRVKKMKDLLREINQHLSRDSLIRYKNLSLPWSIPTDILDSAGKEMSSLGTEEMYSIGKRLLSKFPSALQHGYSNLNYSFIATDKLRSSESAVAFAQGLFEGKGHLGPGKYQPVAIKSSGPSNEDTYLRIFEACPKWKKRTAKANREYANFTKGPEMRRVLEKISDRLKLGKSFSARLEYQWAVEMFLMCAFGIQTDSADTSWCDLFEEEDLKVLEYLNDLKLYWDRSYGRKINHRMSCRLYENITVSFNRFLESGKPHGVFRFAHTGTVIPLLTMLGMYKDVVPLRADNYLLQANRKFRISNVVPMGGNVAFVLYNCKNESSMNLSDEADEKRTFSVSQMTIQLLVNEAAVPMPACGGRMYCGLQKFLNYYSHIKRNCDIDRICGKKKAKCARIKSKEQE